MVKRVNLAELRQSESFFLWQWAWPHGQAGPVRFLRPAAYQRRRMDPLLEEEEDLRDLVQRQYVAVAVSDIRSMAEVVRNISGDVKKQVNMAKVLDDMSYHKAVRPTKTFRWICQRRRKEYRRSWSDLVKRETHLEIIQEKKLGWINPQHNSVHSLVAKRWKHNREKILGRRQWHPLGRRSATEKEVWSRRRTRRRMSCERVCVICCERQDLLHSDFSGGELLCFLLFFFSQEARAVLCRSTLSTFLTRGSKTKCYSDLAESEWLCLSEDGSQQRLPPCASMRSRRRLADDFARTDGGCSPLQHTAAEANTVRSSSAWDPSAKTRVAARSDPGRSQQVCMSGELCLVKVEIQEFNCLVGVPTTVVMSLKVRDDALVVRSEKTAPVIDETPVVARWLRPALAGALSAGRSSVQETDNEDSLDYLNAFTEHVRGDAEGAKKAYLLGPSGTSWSRFKPPSTPCCSSLRAGPHVLPRRYFNVVQLLNAAKVCHDLQWLNTLARSHSLFCEVSSRTSFLTARALLRARVFHITPSLCSILVGPALVMSRLLALAARGASFGGWVRWARKAFRSTQWRSAASSVSLICSRRSWRLRLCTPLPNGGPRLHRQRFGPQEQWFAPRHVGVGGRDGSSALLHGTDLHVSGRKVNLSLGCAVMRRVQRWRSGKAAMRQHMARNGEVIATLLHFPYQNLTFIIFTEKKVSRSSFRSHLMAATRSAWIVWHTTAEELLVSSDDLNVHKMHKKRSKNLELGKDHTKPRRTLTNTHTHTHTHTAHTLPSHDTTIHHNTAHDTTHTLSLSQHNLHTTRTAHTRTSFCVSASKLSNFGCVHDASW